MNTRLRSLVRRIPVGSAFDLAVFRVTVSVLLLTSASAAVAPAWAELPPDTRVAPLGVGWLVPHLVITRDSVELARVVLRLAALTSALGLFTRASLASMALCASYVLLVPQLGGAVFHDHHLVWFAVLLAASPAGDALSIDAWLAARRGTRPPSGGRAHGAALRVAWLLVAAIFFFPGLHKVRASGLDWILSDNLRNQLWWKWAQDPSLLPSLRIDRDPMVLRACAALTVALELAFPVLLLRPATRALAVVCALLFHQATAYFMGIEFGVLYACYVVFVPWEALVRRLRRAGTDAATTSDAGLGRVVGVGVVLLGGVVAAGATGATQAYPFACYPTFQWMPSAEMPALVVELEDPGGSVRVVDRRDWREPGPRGWALEWRLAGIYDRVDRPRIEAYFRDVARREPLARHLGRARAVRVHRAQLSVDPERRGVETSRRFLHRFVLRAGDEDQPSGAVE